MERKEFLMNLGFFYAIIVPEERKCYILNDKNFESEDVQNFINNEPIDYSKFQVTGLPYDANESWTSYLEAHDQKTYTAEENLSEDQYMDYLSARKNTDGLVLAVKDPAKSKVKVFKKNMRLFHA
jgi:hypothetical protein